MSADIKQVSFGKKAVPGLAADLRRMADAVERGEVTDVVMCFVEGDCYCYLWAASLFDSVGMTALAHRQAIDRMRRE